MNSVAGNKERIAVPARSRKYGVPEPCSPTRPAAPFSPESWYRKAYEESRTGSRPAPEGAGSILGSSGTPSPGSGTSSPGSFSGSPGPASPGIGTSSPGSLGGSPGFGTGSPGSGSGGGSSPGSERGVWCETCSARLLELKRQALKLLSPGTFSGKLTEPLTCEVPNTERISHLPQPFDELLEKSNFHGRQSHFIRCLEDGGTYRMVGNKCRPFKILILFSKALATPPIMASSANFDQLVIAMGI